MNESVYSIGGTILTAENRSTWSFVPAPRYAGYLLTHLLIPWCRVLLEKLTGLQLVKKFPAFHGTRRFITTKYHSPETRHSNTLVDCIWHAMAHAQKPDFVFRRNGRVHLNWRGRQFSRLLAAEVCASAVVMLDTPFSEVMWRVLVTHSIRQFPLHSPPVSHRLPSYFSWSLPLRLERLNKTTRTTVISDIVYLLTLPRLLLTVTAHVFV